MCVEELPKNENMSIDRYRQNFGKAKPLPGQPGYGMKESERLMLETKNMEQKLRNLRSVISTQKEERSVTTGGRWASARTDRGSLRAYNKDVKSGAAKKSKVVKHDVKRWGVNDVAAWLRGLNMERYVDVFLQNEIDGPVLLDVGQDDLDYMQIGVLGHRKQIMKELERLKRGRSEVVLVKEPKIPQRQGKTIVPSPPSPSRLASSRKHDDPSPIKASPARKIHWSHVAPLKENEVSGDGRVPVNLADGHFDEKGQQESFQAAVMAWRQGGDSDENRSSIAGLWTNPFGTAPPGSSSSPEKKKTSLLEGKLDEEAEKIAFRDAVNDWRRGNASTSNQSREINDAQPDFSPKQSGGRFLKGDFNEAEEHEKFRNAVNSWRHGADTINGGGRSPGRKVAEDLQKKFEAERNIKRKEFEAKKKALDEEMSNARAAIKKRRESALQKIAESKQQDDRRIRHSPEKKKTDYSNIWDVEIEY